MGDNTRNQTAPTIEKNHKQKAAGDRADDLAEIRDKPHATAVQQIQNMPQTEGNAGYDDGGFDIFLRQRLEQKASENHFFQKADAEHAEDIAHRIRGREIYGEAEPEIPGHK